MKCDSPHYVKPKGYLKDIPVPCGKCPPCKQRRVSEWSFRLSQELEDSKNAYFVTLTYDTVHVPISESGYMTLVKTVESVNKNNKIVRLPHEKSFQAFMKRLRKFNTSYKIKYYAVGEYGSIGSRPHYHAIIFNLQNVEFIDKAWLYGSTHVGTVTPASIVYCLKYIDKLHTIPAHRNDDRLKEFSLMSKGLGKKYVASKANIKYHKDDISRNYVQNGKFRVPMPRYYRERIYDEDDKAKQRILIQMMEKSEWKEFVKDTRKKYGENYHPLQRLYDQKIGRFNNFYNQFKKIRDETRFKSKRLP